MFIQGLSETPKLQSTCLHSLTPGPSPAPILPPAGPPLAPILPPAGPDQPQRCHSLQRALGRPQSSRGPGPSKTDRTHGGRPLSYNGAEHFRRLATGDLLAVVMSTVLSAVTCCAGCGGGATGYPTEPSRLVWRAL